MISRYAQTIGLSMPIQQPALASSSPARKAFSNVVGDQFVSQSAQKPHFSGRIRNGLTTTGTVGGVLFAIWLNGQGQDTPPALPDGTVHVPISNQYIGTQPVATLLEVPVVINGKSTNVTFAFMKPTDDGDAAKIVKQVVDDKQIKPVNEFTLNPGTTMVLVQDGKPLGFISKQSLHKTPGKSARKA